MSVPRITQCVGTVKVYRLGDGGTLSEISVSSFPFDLQNGDLVKMGVGQCLVQVGENGYEVIGSGGELIVTTGPGSYYYYPRR